MEGFEIGRKITLLARQKKSGENKWQEKQGIVLAVNSKSVLIGHKNYKESYMINEFHTGDLRIKTR
ncbi:MAG: hypothetical protein RSA29_02755 [Clostridium sp.]